MWEKVAAFSRRSHREQCAKCVALSAEDAVLAREQQTGGPLGCSRSVTCGGARSCMCVSVIPPE